jgi:hypothetical protein
MNSSVASPRRIFLSLIATTFLLVTVVHFPALAAADVGDGERFQRTFTLASGGSVDVSNDRGKTIIEGWDKEQVVVDVVKHFEGSSSNRDEWMRGTEVRFENTPSRVKVKVVLPEHYCFGYCDWRGGVDITMHVPRRVQLELAGDRTEISVASIEGDLKASLDRGSIAVQRLVGGIRINSDRATVRIHDVDIRNDLDVRADRADIDFEGTGLTKGGTFEADRGNVVVRLPSNVRLQVEVASSRRSSFHSDFPMVTSGGWREGTVRGSINGGGPTLRLKTDRGSVYLEKGLAASL